LNPTVFWSFLDDIESLWESGLRAQNLLSGVHVRNGDTTAAGPGRASQLPGTGLVLCQEDREGHPRIVRVLNFPAVNRTHEKSNPQRRSLLSAIVSDVHFWIPLGVLMAGLLLLHELR
jgi:hypothetical protein